MRRLLGGNKKPFCRHTVVFRFLTVIGRVTPNNKKQNEKKKIIKQNAGRTSARQSVVCARARCAFTHYPPPQTRRANRARPVAFRFRSPAVDGGGHEGMDGRQFTRYRGSPVDSCVVPLSHLFVVRSSTVGARFCSGVFSPSKSPFVSANHRLRLSFVRFGAHFY